MHAGLRAEEPVRVFAVGLDRRALDARHFTGRFLEHLDGKALALAVAQVHAQKHRRPVLRLGAAAARLDIDERTAGVERVVEHAPEFEIGDGALELRDVGLDRDQRSVVALLARELVEFRTVVKARMQLRQRHDDAVELLLLLAELLRTLRVVPDLRVFELAFDGRETRRLHLDVKDTSEAATCDP